MAKLPAHGVQHLSDEVLAIITNRLSGDVVRDAKTIRDMCKTFKIKPRTVLAALKGKRII